MAVPERSTTARALAAVAKVEADAKKSAAEAKHTTPVVHRAGYWANAARRKASDAK